VRRNVATLVDMPMGAKIVAIDLIDNPAASLKPTWQSSATDGRQLDRPLLACTQAAGGPFGCHGGAIQRGIAAVGDLLRGE
jgi:hypothetical protein